MLTAAEARIKSLSYEEGVELAFILKGVETHIKNRVITVDGISTSLITDILMDLGYELSFVNGLNVQVSW